MLQFTYKTNNYTLQHPVYAWMSWVCALNPSDNIFVDEKYSPLSFTSEE